MNPRVIAAFFEAHGIPAPVAEHKFHPVRRWKMDFAWLDQRVALEVQGGIWTQGRHSRGAALLQEWEKLNVGAAMGWRFLYCQPKDLLTTVTVQMVKAALDWKSDKPKTTEKEEPT